MYLIIFSDLNLVGTIFLIEFKVRFAFFVRRKRGNSLKRNSVERDLEDVMSHRDLLAHLVKKTFASETNKIPKRPSRVNDA